MKDMKKIENNEKMKKGVKMMNNEKMKKFGFTRKIVDDFQGLPLLL